MYGICTFFPQLAQIRYTETCLKVPHLQAARARFGRRLCSACGGQDCYAESQRFDLYIHTHVCIYIYIYMNIYIYIYTHRERERERDRYRYDYTYIHTYTPRLRRALVYTPRKRRKIVCAFPNWGQRCSRSACPGASTRKNQWFSFWDWWRCIHPVCCLRFVSDWTQALDILSAASEFMCYYLSKRGAWATQPCNKSWMANSCYANSAYAQSAY